MSNNANNTLNFWEHLDILRAVIIRIIVVSLIFSVVAFMFKDEVFSFVLAPKSSSFATYQIFNKVCSLLSLDSIGNFDVQLINTGLAQQFIIHVKISVCIGIICVSPYIIYQLFSFVSPALYSHEKENTVRIVWSGYLMFALGIIFSYFLIFPLTLHFLGTYQVAGDVINLISLESYISTLIVMCLCMGIVFEIPVLAWILARLGLVDDKVLRKYRKHSIVIILIIAAVITPTSDIVTLLIVSLPMYLLYEMSIILVRRTVKS